MELMVPCSSVPWSSWFPVSLFSAAVAKSLSYYQLAELLRHNSKMADVAVAYILQKLHEVYI